LLFSTLIKVAGTGCSTMTTAIPTFNGLYASRCQAIAVHVTRAREDKKQDFTASALTSIRGYNIYITSLLSNVNSYFSQTPFSAHFEEVRERPPLPIEHGPG
jgi:hypothetical protein